MITITEKYICPECYCKDLKTDKHMLYCTNCGLIISSISNEYVNGIKVYFPLDESIEAVKTLKNNSVNEVNSFSINFFDHKEHLRNIGK